MKNNLPQNKCLNTLSATEKDTLDSTQKKITFPKKAFKNMPAQPITPPSRVWNKIEAILDEQEKRRQGADDIIAASFGISSGYTYKKFFIATTACLSMAAGLMWIIC